VLHLSKREKVLLGGRKRLKPEEKPSGYRTGHPQSPLKGRDQKIQDILNTNYREFEKNLKKD